MPQFSILVASFPGDGRTEQGVADWLVETFLAMRDDATVGRVSPWHPHHQGRRIPGDTPIPMLRNKCLIEAETGGFDFVLMVDSDMEPDMIPGAPPFWSVAWPFARDNGPCVIAAPYCGPPPIEYVYVSKWHNKEGDHANPDFALGPMPRGEAALQKGIGRVAAIGTGLMLIDMRAIKRLPHPRFYYEWTDATQSAKASTEDITFTRDLENVGISVYCAWDCWAGHWKKKLVGPPKSIPAGAVPAMLRQRAKELAGG